jgi:hypothetical protein
MGHNMNLGDHFGGLSFRALQRDLCAPYQAWGDPLCRFLRTNIPVDYTEGCSAGTPAFHCLHCTLDHFLNLNAGAAGTDRLSTSLQN